MIKNKYHNKIVEADGIKFQSKSEYLYYEQLKWLKANKQIKDFELQPRFLLQESFRKNGKTFHKIEYNADFKVINLDDSVEIIDIKGMLQLRPEFSIKRKLFERKYLYTLKLLTYVKKLGGFIEVDEYKKLIRANKKAEK